METRNRSKRAVASIPPSSTAGSKRVTRKARQTTIPASEGTEATRRGTRQGQSPVATPRAKSRDLMFPQIPRRGARLSGRAESIVSLTTTRGRADDDTEYGEDDNASVASREIDAFPSSGIHHLDEIQVGQSISNAEDEDEDEEQEDTRYQIMALTIQDLAKASDGLMELLEHPNYTNPVFTGLLDLRRNLLRGIRTTYQEPSTEPFIDWAQLINRYETIDDAAPAATIMARANIATALDELRNIQLGHQPDPYPLLSKLNDLFPTYFITSREMHRDLDLALDLRTWYFIETLAGQEQEPDTYALIAEVFCLPAEGVDYLKRFARGPFRGLWDGDGEGSEYEELCSARIVQLVEAIKKNKSDYGIKEMRRLFPFEPLLKSLEAWLVAVHTTLNEVGNNTSARASVQLDTLPGVEEEVEVEDSQTDVAESQPIIRAGTAEGQPSLFFGANSLAYLNGQSKGATRIPPSNQQQAAPPPGAPPDYPDHSNKELLQTPQPESSLYPRSQPRGNGVGASRKRAAEEEALGAEFEADEEPEEEDEDDPFETDTRPVDKGKRAAIATSMPPPKRPRMTAPPPTSSHDAPPPSHPAPPLSTIPEDTIPTSSAPDFAAVRAQKSSIAQRNRLATPAAFKQRYPWSHDDCCTLITLIRDRQAAWATIEREDNDRFEHPRNQQAYRDKARNMKVDYLMIDAVLPPGFDLVALGKKEIDKLKSLGKNPFRKEADIDEDGNAVGTEYGDYEDFDEEM